MKIFLLHRFAAAALLLGAFAVLHSETSPTQTQRFPQFENEDVKVWKSVVMPNAPLTMHRHEHPRVIIALERRHHEDRGPAGQIRRTRVGDGEGLLAAHQPAQHHACRRERRRQTN